MASVNAILAIIIVLGIIYMYINSRQYLVRDGFMSWPGGVVDGGSPPYKVVAGSDTGYHW